MDIRRLEPSTFAVDSTVRTTCPKHFARLHGATLLTNRGMPVNIADLQPAVESLEIAQRVDAIDWMTVDADLDRYGCARVPGLLSASECTTLASLYPHDALYRSRVVMARHGSAAANTSISRIRSRGHRRVACDALPASRANRESLEQGIRDRRPLSGRPRGLPRSLPRSRTTRPTPLILQYGADDYNCLHQDLYGEHVFPPGSRSCCRRPAAISGEFVLTEQRPRMQSRAEVVSLTQGDAVIFAVHGRPVQGTRGVYRVNLRHGVSRIRAATATRSASSSMTRNDG